MTSNCWPLTETLLSLQDVKQMFEQMWAIHILLVAQKRGPSKRSTMLGQKNNWWIEGMILQGSRVDYEIWQLQCMWLYIYIIYICNCIYIDVYVIYTYHIIVFNIVVYLVLYSYCYYSPRWVWWHADFPRCHLSFLAWDLGFGICSPWKSARKHKAGKDPTYQLPHVFRVANS